ncbi:response regulator [Thermodesulfobacterium sp. TA1]|uniref:response regulator n=1 Tax=Thermodesulfobacterium sp. TA1 TaxID=2234087 RepID=UPI001232C540|nr:HD domain-containing phosphohydrolase [Thermodesulfobacterium sp. TA1]QER41327.1 response regulator [Thermodesulfobacterium sp. TA1]
MFLPEIEAPEHTKVFLVDDDDHIRTSLAEVLSLEGFKVFSAKTGQEFLAKLEEVNPDIALIDYLLPGLDGLSLCKIIKNNNQTFEIGVIIITGVNDLETKINCLAAGADDFLTKPIFIPELFVRIKTLSKNKKYREFLKTYQANLEREVIQKTKEIQKIYLGLNEAHEEIRKLSLEIIHRLAKAAEYRDEHTGSHIHRISFYCSRIAEAIGLSQSQIEILQYASPLHDIGKLGIPDKILLKPGPLTPKEWEIMKLHTIIGAKILEGSNIKYLKAAQKIALYHHERWDGKGYPCGLKGKKIPLFARIVAIADVFDALTSNRPYRRALPYDIALQIIKSEKGTRFDPELVDVFLKIKPDILEIRTLFQDEEIPHLFKLYQALAEEDLS